MSDTCSPTAERRSGVTFWPVYPHSIYRGRADGESTSQSHLHFAKNRYIAALQTDLEGLKMARGLKLEKTKNIEFDFHDWGLEANEKFKHTFDLLLREMIIEGLRIAGQDYECWASFSDKKPLRINVTIPIEEDTGYQEPGWSFDLNDLVNQMIKETIEPYDILKSTRDGLRVLANQCRNS